MNATAYRCSNDVIGLDIDMSDVKIDCIMLDLNKYVGKAILCIGTIGHILSILVTALEPTLRSQSSGVYIIALSLTGLLAIYTGLLEHTIQGYTAWEINIGYESKSNCIIHTILTYFSLQLISWLQATIALDRVFHVALPIWKPHFYSRRCRWKHGLLIVCVEAALALALNMFILYVVKYQEKEKICDYSNNQIGQVWSAIDLVSFSLLPSIIIILCNVTIAAAVSRSRVHSENENENVEKTRRSLTIMLMVVNLIFLLTTVPVSIAQVINGDSFSDSGLIRLNLAITVCILIQYLGTACTFIIYCASGSKFRDIIKKWIMRAPVVQKIVESRTTISLFEMT